MAPILFFTSSSDNINISVSPERKIAVRCLQRFIVANFLHKVVRVKEREYVIEGWEIRNAS